MLLSGCVAIVLLQMCWGAEFDYCSLTCDEDVKHTMCVYKKGGGASCKAVKRGLTAEEKKTILDYHNELRAKVANGKEENRPQPSAADMNQLVWDDEVADIAQRWAEQCEQRGGHDKCRITRDKVEVGQNYAERSGSGMAVDRISMINKMVKSWYDEVKNMNPRLVAGFEFVRPPIGHYTQVVWGKTTRVGCGLAHTQEEEGGKFNIRLICNYKVTGNFISKPVYTKGNAASNCAMESAEYPGLCKPQEEGDKPQSDASAPTSSANGSPSAGSSSGGSPFESSKPVAFASSGFGKPVTFASTGSPSGSSKPVAFASSGFGQPVFTYASTSHPAAFDSLGYPQGFASMGSFNADPYKRLARVQTNQFFNDGTDTIPGSFGRSPNGKQVTKVHTVVSGPMSHSDLQKWLSSRMYPQNK